MSIDIKQAALNLAKSSLDIAEAPFRRERHGKYAFQNMQQREGLLRAAKEIYDKETWAHIEALPGQASDIHRQAAQFHINPLKSWISMWSNTYNAEVSRTFLYDNVPVDEVIQEKLSEKYRQMQVDQVLDETDSYMRLVGNVVLVPFYDDVNDEWVLHKYLSYQVRVVENRDNPGRPLATVLVGYTEKQTGDGFAVKEQSSRIFIPVDKNSHLYIVKSEDGYSEELVQGVAPVVHCFDSLPDNNTGYYIPSVGVPLAGAVCLLINDYINPTGYMVLMQNFSVGIAYGLKEGEAAEISPGKMFKFQDKTTEGVEFVAPQPKITETLQYIEFLMESLQKDYQIPTDMFDISTAPSGAAIIQAKGPLAEWRRKRIKLFRSIEDRLAKAVMAELSRTDPDFAGWDSSLVSVTVEYKEPELSMSVQDRVTLEKHLLETGQVSSADLALKANPDKFDGSIEEARKSLAPEAQKEVSPQEKKL